MAISGTEKVTVSTVIPTVFEFKHGINAISVGPPSGVPNKQDLLSPDSYARCAERELHEETGITLEKIIPINLRAACASGRKSNESCRIFLGLANKPESWEQPRPDVTEKILTALLPVTIFKHLIRSGDLPPYCVMEMTAWGLYPALEEYNERKEMGAL